MTLLLLAGLLRAGLAIGAAPATQPVQQVRTWFDQLADPAPTVREAALDHLLGLTSADLPTLKRIAAAAKPLKPSQRTTLSQVVYHVFKSGIKYEPSPDNRGFLGIELSWVELDLDNSVDRGVMVTAAEQGFPSYRMLRPGDILKRLVDPTDIEFVNTQRFKDVIGALTPGETIVMEIEREGKLMKVPVELRVRPAWIDSNDAVNAWRAQMQEEADNYWKDNFSRIVEDERS